MAKKFLTPVNFVSLSTAPSSPLAGDVYFDTSLSKLRFWSGTEWVNTEVGPTGPTGPQGEIGPTGPAGATPTGATGFFLSQDDKIVTVVDGIITSIIEGIDGGDSSSTSTSTIDAGFSNSEFEETFDGGTSSD
jgi:hypothetical protein